MINFTVPGLAGKTTKEGKMKILILNGNPDPDRGNMDPYINRLQEKLNAAGHDAGVVVLRDLKIGYCTGCFNCWLRRPVFARFRTMPSISPGSTSRRIMSSWPRR